MRRRIHACHMRRIHEEDTNGKGMSHGCHMRRRIHMRRSIQMYPDRIPSTLLLRSALKEKKTNRNK
jgi:hypothetical protein